VFLQNGGTSVLGYQFFDLSEQVTSHKFLGLILSHVVHQRSPKGEGAIRLEKCPNGRTIHSMPRKPISGWSKKPKKVQKTAFPMPGKKLPGKITKIPLPRPDVRSLSNVRLTALFNRIQVKIEKGITRQNAALLARLHAEKKRRIKIGTMKEQRHA
jgi:hypothetical protein